MRCGFVCRKLMECVGAPHSWSEGQGIAGLGCRYNHSLSWPPVELQDGPAELPRMQARGQDVKVAEALPFFEDKSWTGRGVKLGAASFLPSSGWESECQSWLGVRWGLTTRPGRGGRERSLHGSPEELFGPHLSLEAHLFCSEGAHWSRRDRMSQCSDSHAPGGCLLPWPPSSCPDSRLPSLSVPCYGRISWPCFCLEVLGSVGDSVFFPGPG